MPLPGNLDTITVTANYNHFGPGHAGEVTFEPNVPTLIDGTAPAFLLGSITAKLDANGLITAVLPYNDDPQLSPSGWVWKVTESIVGRPVRSSWYINLTHDMGPSIDLADPRIAPMNPAPPVSTIYGVLTNPNVWEALNNFANGLAISGTTIAPPPGGTSRFLAADGTWQTPPTGGGGGLTPIVRDAFITSGSVHFNTDAAFVAYPAIGITIPATADDNIAITISGMWAKIGGDFCDLAVVVGGTAVRFASSQTATAAIEGVPWLYPDPAYRTCGGVFSFQASAGDIDTDGSIHVALFHKGPAGGTWFADLNYATSIHAVNNRH